MIAATSLSAEATNSPAPSSQKLRGKLKWNPIKRISLFAFDGWNGRVGLALLWGLRAAAAASAPQRERPAQPNNPSFNLLQFLSIHEFFSFAE